MAPQPKKSHSRSRSNIRKNAATNRYMLPDLIRCPNCKKLKFPHTTCSHCGTYKSL